MKRVLPLLIALILAYAPPLLADKNVSVLAATSTNQEVVVNTEGYNTAVVSVSGASATGTVTVYVAPSASSPQRTAVATYATPSTTKTYRGPTSGALVVALTGNTTGTATVTAVLK